MRLVSRKAGDRSDGSHSGDYGMQKRREIMRDGRRVDLCLLVFVLVLVIVGCDRKGNDRPTPNGDEETPSARLHSAVRRGDLSLVQSLIAEGYDVDDRDKEGCTPLLTAAGRGQTDIVKLLISRGAEVDARNRNGGTALHVAAWDGRADIAKQLIEAGADVNAGRDRSGMPLYAVPHLLPDQGHEDVARLLLAHGAEIIPGDTRENEHLLYFAVVRGMHDLMEKLLAGGANPNTVESGATGMSVLGEAVARGDAEAVRLLIAGGADVNGKDVQGMPPLRYARHWSKDAVKLLLAKGANPHEGFLLHYFVDADEKDVLEVCLAHGADVNARNLAGETPLDVAIALGEGREEIAELLKGHGGIRGVPGKESPTP